MKKIITSTSLLLLLSNFLWHVTAQSTYKELSFKKERKKKTIIPFKIAHNLMIIPVFINDSDTLHFILDSGVTHTLVTGLDGGGALSLQYSRQIDLFGLGEGEPIQALHSFGNEITLDGGIIGKFHDLLIPLEDIFYLSESLGTNVNGLIGYEIFNSFIVEVHYATQKIILRNPNTYQKAWERKKKKWLKKGKAVSLPITIEKRKPYVNLGLENVEGKKVDVKMIVDSGASHALSVYSSTTEDLKVPEKSFQSFLGVGLSGEVYGQVSRLPKLHLDKFSLESPIVTFPSTKSIEEALVLSDRNGSIGSDVLRRFTVIFDYTNGEIILKPNADFKEKFVYNMSGIEISTPIPGLPVYQVAQVREGSPAEKAGVQRGDQIMRINGTSVVKFSLNDILEVFQNKKGRKIRLALQRNNKWRNVDFILEDLLDNSSK